MLPVVESAVTLQQLFTCMPQSRQSEGMLVMRTGMLSQKPPTLSKINFQLLGNIRCGTYQGRSSSVRAPWQLVAATNAFYTALAQLPAAPLGTGWSPANWLSLHQVELLWPATDRLTPISLSHGAM